MDHIERLHSFGEFRVGNRSIFGELKVHDSLTNLRLHSHEYIRLAEIFDRHVLGDLPDGRKVSLIECNVPPVPGSSFGKAGKSYFADIFPHYVVVGANHVMPGEDAVTAIYWHLPSLSSAFYDFDAFGFSVSPEHFIGAIVAEQEQKFDRKITIGESPEVLYFTGRHKVFSGDVSFGTFSVGHCIQKNFGGPPGVWMKNELRATIRFNAANKFADAINHAYQISQFLSVVIGGPQSVERISIEIGDQSGRELLDVFPSLPIRYEWSEGDLRPGPADALLDGARGPDEFASVLKHWLATVDEMATPRRRFWDSFSKQNFYDADRMIAAANLFDTVPSELYPSSTVLSAELNEAIAKAKALFKPLPHTPERESILRELSQITQPRLRSKVKHWARDLVNCGQYEGLEFAIDCAVKCRNFYVHGGKADFDYEKNFNMFSFLVRTLEFCYIAPELLRGGWSLAAWRKRSHGYHPFGDFTVHYSDNVARLRELVRPVK